MTERSPAALNFTDRSAFQLLESSVSDWGYRVSTTIETDGQIGFAQMMIIKRMPGPEPDIFLDFYKLIVGRDIQDNRYGWVLAAEIQRASEIDTWYFVGRDVPTAFHRFTEAFTGSDMKYRLSTEAEIDTALNAL